MRGTALRTAATLAFAAAIAACSGSAGPSNEAQVNFNLATRPAAAATQVATTASLAVVGTPETYNDGTDTLVIDQVQLVLREIELKRTESTAACGESSAGDACEKLELGPILLDLPLGGVGGAARTFSVAVAPGTYDEVEFEIHRPSDDDDADASFVQAHPDFAGVSLKVTGTWNGQPFTYTSDLNAEEEIELSPPLVTTESAATDLTLFVDLGRWFRDGAGNLVDPKTAGPGGANESLVKNNIGSTLHAFEDENHDGSDDHGGDDESDG
jgi:hypothetical protein